MMTNDDARKKNNEKRNFSQVKNEGGGVGSLPNGLVKVKPDVKR